MRRDLQVNKYKLIRLTGKDIWGHMLTRHAVYLRLRVEDLSCVVRKVVNFVIIEYERRRLFDFFGRYSSFVKKKRSSRTFFPLLLNFWKTERNWLFRWCIEFFSSTFRPSYFKFTGGYFRIPFVLRSDLRERYIVPKGSERYRFLNHSVKIGIRKRLPHGYGLTFSLWQDVTTLLNCYLYSWHKYYGRAEKRLLARLRRMRYRLSRNIRYYSHPKHRKMLTLLSIIDKKFLGPNAWGVHLSLLNRLLEKVRHQFSEKWRLKLPALWRWLSIIKPVDRQHNKSLRSVLRSIKRLSKIKMKTRKRGCRLVAFSTRHIVPRFALSHSVILSKIRTSLIYPYFWFSSLKPGDAPSLSGNEVTSPVLAGFSVSRVSRPAVGFYLQLTRTGRVRAAWRSLRSYLATGFIRNRLKNPKNFILQLSYGNPRVAFGDYEEGFRIPHVSGDHFKRSKKQFRMLEFYRIQTFYGLFDLRAFKQKYFELFKAKKYVASRKLYQLLECRVIFILHMTNVFPSMYFIDQLLTHRHFVLHDVVVTNPHHVLSVGDSIFTPRVFYWRALNVFMHKLVNFRLILNMPLFCEPNYVLLAAALVSIPLKHQLTVPFHSTRSSFDRYSLVKNAIF
nr:ribsomal protein S4 [Balamuthia mandrillaris]